MADEVYRDNRQPSVKERNLREKLAQLAANPVHEETDGRVLAGRDVYDMVLDASHLWEKWGGGGERGWSYLAKRRPQRRNVEARIT